MTVLQLDTFRINIIRMVSVIDDQGQTDRVITKATDCSTMLTLTVTLTLTYDLEF